MSEQPEGEFQLPEPVSESRSEPRSELISEPIEEKSAQVVESKVREYLSNERTYLSWMRTAISLLGVGVILARIQAFQPPIAQTSSAWQLGLIFAIIGVIVVFLATQHYLAIRRELADDYIETTGRWVILFSILVVLLGSSIVYYVFSYAPHLSTG